MGGKIRMRERDHVLDRKLTTSVVAYVLVFLSLAVSTVPRLTSMTREAIVLRQLSYKQRRSRVIGPLYDGIASVRASLRSGEPVAIVLNPAPRNIGEGLFAGYYLYPRRTKLYFSRAAYNQDASPSRPAAIAYVDTRASAEVRRLSYAEVRAEEIGNDFVIRDARPNAESTSFIVPIVASSDGPAPDVYTTEGVIVNEAGVPSHIAFELFPSHRRTEATLGAGERRTWNDAVYQLFGVNEVGWMRVVADGKVRFQFWFVNHGRRSAASLPPIEHAAARHICLASPPESKLWIVNPNERDVAVSANATNRTVPPMSIVSVPASGETCVESEMPIIAFASWREKGGATNFAWPDKQ
jgi:hypothetical protein